MICEAVRADPDTYTEGFLEKDPAKYCRWISDPSCWGGAIELSVLCRSAALLQDPLLPLPPKLSRPAQRSCTQSRGRETSPRGAFQTNEGQCRGSEAGTQPCVAQVSARQPHAGTLHGILDHADERRTSA